MMLDNIGTCMKENYEDRQRYYLTRRTPVIIRVDGRAFHTFTKNFRKPFDQRFHDAMVISANHVLNETQGCKLAYIQSDEASFVLTDYDTLDTQAWFDYCKSKIESITVSMMTYAFSRCMRLAKIINPAYFDARAFNIPESEVVNYFLWRTLDWRRNSVLMYAQHYFSHTELNKKSISDIHEMLHTIGKNWTIDLMENEKNGTFIHAGGFITNIEPKYDQIAALWDKMKPC
jgi:tRNA(His) guanylyltransferase